MLLDISQKIKSLRKKYGYTIQAVAEGVGIAVRTYQNYEYGQREISAETLFRLADFYGVTTDYLLGREPAPDPIKQLTNEQLEQKLVEGYFKLPKEYRETFLDGLRQAVMECCPDYAPPSPEPEPDNLIIDDVKKEWQAQGIGQK